MSISGESYVWKPYITETSSSFQIPGSSSGRSPGNLMKEACDLNAKWKEIANDKQTFLTVNYFGVNGELEDEKEHYDFAKVRTAMVLAHEQGKKVCLAIGRTAWEKLPSDTGDAEENEIWFPVDCSLTPQLKDTPEVKDWDKRLFLWVDVNMQKFLLLIQGLVDTIFIDISTTKAFQTDFAKRFCFLLRDSTSKMIFENPVKQAIKTQGASCQAEFSSESYTYLTSIDYVVQKQDILINRGVPKEEALEKADEEINKATMTSMTEHLKTIFSSVIYHENDTFPYQSTGDNIDYYVVSGKKD